MAVIGTETDAYVRTPTLKPLRTGGPLAPPALNPQHALQIPIQMPRSTHSLLPSPTNQSRSFASTAPLNVGWSVVEGKNPILFPLYRLSSSVDSVRPRFEREQGARIHSAPQDKTSNACPPTTYEYSDDIPVTSPIAASPTELDRQLYHLQLRSPCTLYPYQPETETCYLRPILPFFFFFLFCSP